MENNTLNSPISLEMEQYKDSNSSMNGQALNPQFDSITPEVIIQNIEDLTREEVFPIDVFPEIMQHMISETNRCLNFPTDFMGASILYAFSVAIGNTHRIRYKATWEETAVLYITLVGRPGTSKSHPIKKVLKPIFKKDSEAYKNYEAKKREYDQLMKLPPEERGNNKHVEKPIFEQILLNDYTPEALIEVHKHNKRGLGIYADELASWFKNFNRYNKGSEEETWLSIWSNTPITINRKIIDPIKLNDPFVSVIGTIQNEKLNELAINRTDNGFVDRVLFAFPDDLKKAYWNDEEIDPTMEKKWEEIILRVLNQPLNFDELGNAEPHILNYTPEARKMITQWQHQLTSEVNKKGDDTEFAISAKMEIYVHRFALILHMIDSACKNSFSFLVDIKAVEGAIKLAEYFYTTALKVHRVISNADPLSKLPTNKQKIYIDLPDEFTTGEGLDIAEKRGMKKRTFKAFLNDRVLFEKVEHGKYSKLY